MKYSLMLLATLALLASQVSYSDAPVIEDGDISMSRAELEFIIKNWPGQMRRGAANDLGQRYEALNKAMASKRIAREGEFLELDPSSDEYWRREILLRRTLHTFVVQRFLGSIDVPDMRPLARERYDTQREKYAFVPEKRLSSHILLVCVAGRCDEKARKSEAEVIRARLLEGENFADLASRLSEDSGTKLNGGKFDTLIAADDSAIDRAYREAVFALEKVGDFSPVIKSRFGYHVVKLDEIQPSYHKTFDEVQGQIIADLATEYRDLQIELFDDQYRFSDELKMDGAVLEEIFAPYKSGAAAPAQ